MKWKIDNVKIDNQVVLAPMAGICDSAYRRIIKSMGCGLIETEMVSTRAVMHLNRKTREMLEMTDFERPIAQQIFGSDSESFKTASSYIAENMNPDIIDINMGCPVTKVAVKSGAGSALLKSPEKVEEIIQTVKDSVSIPVTVKIRSGWNKNNAVEIAKIAEKSGASAIAVHPRTRQQRYDIPSDWSIIKDVKDNVSIPVIGNGDIRSCYDAKAMLEITGCDAIMIGRGVLGNPWIIKQCIDYLDYGIKPERIASREKLDMFKRHADMIIGNYEDKVVMHKLRTNAAYYMKNLHGSQEIKKRIFQTTTKEELFDLLENYVKTLKY
ncbi:MAG: tRNA dihydrouridine synthase DusB [Methanobrevibacter millerae]|uniref:tRNA dihydrouridine synthase DusB n=1 Tax=Methanobrevibacter millerae TaxID=230361 RepID=A0A8T3VCL8_9EURY|nr:tRNA dihydrouridine synthase DusB [Methanobrevibacter millerae]MBE6505849.1 tRNA dihydrouridine synthase DusB [Methanobrevibacter millerae]